MFLRIETLGEKKLVGQHRTMSLAANTTPELWKGFMQQCASLPPGVGGVLYSLQVYAPAYFNKFHPEASFEKWAALEVMNVSNIPTGFETLLLTGGLYAVFLHKGPASAGPETFRYIFATWLPSSAYDLDNRPHFEVLGEKYKHEDPSSEEEIWIPIKPR
jgi:AraC family transcriptional regulator